MGCFSFKCKICGEPVRSDSSRGEDVHLFLLKNGNVIEYMRGEYDSYGRVFNDSGDSEKWNMPWDEVCNLMFSENEGSGIAAMHVRCCTSIHSCEFPTTRSEDDPDQGWGPFQIDGERFGTYENEDEEDY